MFLLVASACTAPTGDTSVAVRPSAYSYETSSQDDSEDLGVMQAEIQFILDNIRSYNGGPVIDAWYEAHRYSDGACPNDIITETEINGTVVYFDSECISQDRYWFKGPMTTYTFADKDFQGFDVADFLPYLEGGYDTLWTGQAIKGQTDVYDAESDLDFNCSCTAVRAVSIADPDALEWLSYSDGPAHWISPSADPTEWMNEGVLSHLFIRYKRESTSRWEVSLQGSITGATEVYGDVALELIIGGMGTGDELNCNPDTYMHVEARRTATGARTAMDLLFEGGACSACTAVGSGEVCLDITEAVDWQEVPW